MEFGLLYGHMEETGLFWVQLVPQLGQGQLSEPADKNYTLETSLWGSLAEQLRCRHLFGRELKWGKEKFPNIPSSVSV